MLKKNIQKNCMLEVQYDVKQCLKWQLTQTQGGHAHSLAPQGVWTPNSANSYNILIFYFISENSTIF